MAERKPREVIEALTGAHEKCPDQRVYQIIANALELAGITYDPFFVEDPVLLQALNDYIRSIEAHD